MQASHRQQAQSDRARLEAERRRIFAELRNYPSPVTACDAQFNHLLAERERIAEELRTLEPLAAQPTE